MAKRITVGVLAATWLALGIVLFQAQPAVSATPEKIRVSEPGSSQGVDITDPRDVVALEMALCSGSSAGSLQGRASLEIVVQWNEDFMWSGRLYPSLGVSPAAVDVPAWKLYGGSEQPATCRSRVVGHRALQVFRRYGIPTTVGDEFLRSGGPVEWIVTATAGPWLCS